MKKRMSKSLISVLLCIAMIASMIACGIVTAGSAEVDAAPQGADLKEIYFTDNYSWGSVNIFAWNDDGSNGNWPGVAMTKLYTNSNNQDVYYVKIDAAYAKAIFNNGKGTQSVDTRLDTTKPVEGFYLNGWDNGKAKTVAWPSVPAAEAEYTVYLADNTDGKWISDNDAVITVNGTEMTKSVDEHTGWTVWYAKIKTVENAPQTFKRLSKIKLDGDYKVWNTWTTSFDKDKPCTVLTTDKSNSDITNADTGTAPTIPAGSITDLWYGLWADTKGNGDKRDCVKIYATNLYSNYDYYLYLPSYVDRSSVTIYTSLYDLKIGSTSVPRATATTVNLSSNQYNLSFKRYDGGSTHNDFKLYVMQTSGVSAMLLTTKKDLYTGYAAAYAANEDGSANYEGAAAYKSSTSDKGTYLMYDSTGALLNPKDKETGAVLDGLKKIKGRGNSTFEASMRLFGKYAYNITLNDKAGLIPGAVAQKKYSLLANNADESLMRNVTVYGIADAVGMPYTPNTRLIDLYDNGNYLGAYVLTEKVEYGKNTLISDAKSLDKFNEDILAEGKGIDYDALKQKTATYTAKSGTTYTYQYSYTTEAGKTYEFDGSTVTIGEGEEAETYTLDETTMKKYDFLLEHELETRYKPEATWFKSNRTGQAVVPKYPEFATQKEVQWMIEQYDALEDAVYDGDYARLCEVADVETFADVYLIQELTMNLDAAATSYNILGGKSFPKLKAAPLWDYDWAAGMYNGKKLTTDGEVDVSDTSKWYVTKKSVKIAEDDGRVQTIPNLQAKMTQMTDFWTLCKSEWTNDFTPVLNNYLGDGKTLLGSTLPEFRSAAAMNESRWNARAKIKSGAHADDPMAGTWGTRSTSEYKKGSYAFSASGSQGFYASGATADSYDNTVYYLNDWLTKRRETMDTTFGLYDPNAVAPTEPTEPAETYLKGDADGNGEVTILDATVVQRKLADLTVNDPEGVAIRGAVTTGTLGILDATAIQRFIAGFENVYGIDTVMTY